MAEDVSARLGCCLLGWWLMRVQMKKVKTELKIVQADMVVQSVALETVRADVKRVETDFNNRLGEALNVGKDTNELVRQLLQKVM